MSQAAKSSRRSKPSLKLSKLQSHRVAKSSSSSNKGAVSGAGLRDQTVINIGRTLMPVKCSRSLVYHEAVAFSGSGGSMGTYVFSTNGLFDPNITSTGHQPAGFDQIMLFYEHYYVTKADIVVTFHNSSATIYPIVALSVNSSPTPITSANQLLEDGSSVRSQLCINGTSGCMTTLKMKCNVASFGGVRLLADASEYQGSIAANPVEQSYFHLSAIDQEALGTANLLADVTIRYQASFIEPRDVSPSLQKQIDALIRKNIASGELKTA